MSKIVVVFPSYDEAVKTTKLMLAHNIADYFLNELSYDYESQIRQELFLSRREGKSIIILATLGLLLGLFLFYRLTLSPTTGTLFSWLLGGGLPVVLFTGGGLGTATGSLLAGLYILSTPLKQDYTGQWLCVLYCQNSAKWADAEKIINSSPGVIL